MKQMDLGIDQVVILAALTVSVLSIIGIILNRIKLKRGIGHRTVQFSIITVMFPLLLILTILKLIPVSTIAVVAGVIIGYAFSKAEGKRGTTGKVV